MLWTPSGEDRTLVRVFGSAENYRLCKVQQLIKFLTFRSVHFHPSRCARPSFPIFRGSGSETSHAVPCPKGIQSVRNHTILFTYAVKIEGVSSCMACTIGKYWLHCMSVFFNKAIASPMSENCCHDTSVSNIYIAAWQEIVKPAKVIELSYVCFTVRSITRCVGTERSDRPGFMRKTRFSLFKPYLQLRQTLLSNIYAVEMHPWQKCYCSWSENWWIHLSQKRKLPLPPFA